MSVRLLVVFAALFFSLAVFARCEDSVLPWSAGRFQRTVESSLQSIAKIISQTRSPVLPADAAHTYQDKFSLVEYLSNVALSTLSSALESAFKGDGSSATAITPAVWQQLHGWLQKDAAITLRFQPTERLQFLRQATRNVESNVQYVQEGFSIFGDSRNVHKTVTKVEEWFWQQQMDWTVSVFAGTGSDARDSRTIQLAAGTGQRELVTNTKDPPHAELNYIQPIDVDITWLLRQFAASGGELVPAFTINRQSAECRTPRRNEQVDSGMKFFRQLYEWSDDVENYLTESLNSAAPTINPFPGNAFDSAITQVFNPIVPLIEEKSDNTSSPLLTVHDADTFLAEFRQTHRNVLSNVLLPLLEQQGTRRFFDAAFVRLLLATKVFANVAVSWSDGVQALEELLRKQLITAIGRQLTPGDFEKYMRYHAKKMFRPEFQPKPFSYAVRGHASGFPDGSIALESTILTGGVSAGAQNSEPVETFVRQLPSFPMRFRLNAATEVTIGGDRFLHTLLMHSFSGDSSLNSLRLFARARQFSSFLLLLGKPVGPDELSIQSAVLLKNGDELRIPLLCETLPSAKAFKDAIASLSPEQQRFAKAYRAMQLDSSVFVLLTIQLKPQLERVLQLNDQTLTKEIQLTQDAMEMFSTFQIPPDLLSFDAKIDGLEADANAKLSAVKKHVSDVQSIISALKKEQLEAAKQQKEYQKAMTDAAAETATFHLTAERNFAAPMMKRNSVRSLNAGDAALYHVSFASVAAKGSRMDDSLQADTESESDSDSGMGGGAEAQDPKVCKGQCEDYSGGNDIRGLPSLLDRALEKYDVDGSVRPTTIAAGPVWSKSVSSSLLSRASSESILASDEQDSERRRSFELLDALSRSGALELSSASVHVVVAATHHFDKSLISTVVEDNVNPIEKLERSALILQSVLQRSSIEKLVKDEAMPNIKTFSAANLIADGVATAAK